MKLHWPWYLVFSVVILAAGISSYSYFTLRSSPGCAFPQAVQDTASIILYCPDETKLPDGVTSDVASATLDGDVVLYSIKDGSSNLAVSLQKKPSAEALDNFFLHRIPLYFEVETPVGKSKTGVANELSLTTLPTNSNTWIIITAPKEYSPDRLTEILKTFRAN